MTIEELNALPLKDFKQQFETLLEHCDWVLPLLANSRPFMSVEDMNNKLEIAMINAPVGLQKNALQLHPKLGVGRAQPGFSQSEQKQAGLSNLSDQELALFKQLNREYENKMGYPFVVAVTGMDKQQILELMDARLKTQENLEWQTSLEQLIKIAQIRVTKLVDG